jgi:zinc/manganese transport system substrate-binding protein
MKHFLSMAVVAALLLAAAPARAAGPLVVVAAENFYGDVAEQIGRAHVKVTSILNNPDQDPHLFEASPSVARALSTARVVIYNGIDYDPWIEKLLGAARRAEREVIVVAALVGKKPGDNPHIWYDPATMLALAKTLTDELSAIDPPHRVDYRRQLQRFQQSMQPIEAKIAVLRARLSGTPVAATEPVFGHMLDALGIPPRNQRFQLAVMNNTEPSASDVAALENDLKTRQVRLLVYNRQVSSPMVKRMLNLAKASHIPVVSVTETEPPGKNYQEWILSELDAVGRALPD